jgi:hypothetical protein
MAEPVKIFLKDIDTLFNEIGFIGRLYHQIKDLNYRTI